jgi:hypothetical protein
MAMKVLARAKAPRGALDLLRQPVHGLDEGVAAVIGHAAHHRAEVLLDGGDEFLEWFEPTAPGQLSQSRRSVAACSALLCARARA